LIRSAKSIGASYTEASGASSKKDFRNKIYICYVKENLKKQNANLRMLAICSESEKNVIRKSWAEAQKLILIFGEIVSKLRN